MSNNYKDSKMEEINNRIFKTKRKIRIIKAIGVLGFLAVVSDFTENEFNEIVANC